MTREIKKIVVTGGAGMIGLEVCKQLTQLGHEVRLLDLGEQIQRVRDAIPRNCKVYYGSIVDLSSLRESMQGADSVIHLAALLGVQRSERDMLKTIEINIEGTKNVLDCAVQSRIKKIVFSSSSEVYGEPIETPITENTMTQGKTVYAVTKMAGEELCRAYNQKYPIEYTILRYFNCYGPYQNAQFVLAKFIKNVLDNKSPEIYGDGSQIRSYSYVSDTARATVQAILRPEANGKIINIGNGNAPITLSELAQKVIKIAGKDGKLNPIYKNFGVDADRIKSREIFKRFCDGTRAKELLGWEPSYSLDQGIKAVIDSGIIFDRWENLYEDNI